LIQISTGVRCKCESFAPSLASTVVSPGLSATARPNVVIIGRTERKRDTPHFPADQLQSAGLNRIVAGAVMVGMLQSTVRMEDALIGNTMTGVKVKKTAGG